MIEELQTALQRGRFEETICRVAESATKVELEEVVLELGRHVDKMAPGEHRSVFQRGLQSLRAAIKIRFTG